MTNAGRDEFLVLNGIDIETGDYLTPRLALAEVADALRGDPRPLPAARDLRRRRHNDEAHFGVMYGRDPEDLASVGWGVVIPADLDPAISEALEPLFALRQDQAGDLFRRLDARPGEDKDDFLARYGMGPSVADPRKVPYYLLLLGTPDQVSFDFQYQLGVSYAVGRVDLADPDACAAYAANVLAAERSIEGPVHRTQTSPARRLQFFATRHPGDTSTALSASHLVAPLHAELREHGRTWQIGCDVGPAATRARLEGLLTGPLVPDVLFTASHGVGGKAMDREIAGALLCQDWPGPLAARAPVGEAHYLAAHHLPSDLTTHPKVVFSFACFGAGTPGISDYPGELDEVDVQSAAGFTARLPQRLLGAPSGGTLAFVGHVDRAWSCSFLWKGLAAQVTPFRSTLLAVMDGVRLGSAMESMTARYAEIATELISRMYALRRRGKRIDDYELVGLWTATHDARSYVVIGDPAVRVVPRGTAGLAG